MNDLFFARSQMGMSLAFHIIFAVIGMAMPLLMAVSEGCLCYLKIRCPTNVPGPDQLVGTAPARVDGSKRDHRSLGALVS